MSSPIINDYSRFDPSRLDNFHSKYDKKIQNGESLSQNQKIKLGKELWKVNNYTATLSFFFSKIFSESDDYYIENADKYIQYKRNKNIQLDNLDFPNISRDKEVDLWEIVEDSLEKSTSSSSNDEKDEIIIPIGKTDRLATDALSPLMSPKGKPTPPRSHDVTPRNDELIEWVASLKLPPSQAKRLISQYNDRYPLIWRMVKEIQISQKTSQNNAAALQKSQRQLSNLVQLSTLIYELTLFNNDNEALLRLDFPLLKKSSSQDLFTKIFSGEISLSDSKVAQNVFSILADEIENIKSEIASSRSKFPISDESLQAHSTLHKALRESKSWSATQQNIPPLGTSVNTVRRLMDPKVQTEASAFFKEEALFEKMMWDIALVLGFEEKYTPTTITNLHTANELQGSKEKAIIWGDDGDNKDIRTERKAQRGRKGSLQPAVKGEYVRQYLQSQKNTLPKDEINQTIFTTLAMGMGDAHGLNMVINPKLKIQSFDNTRSLPHSNTAINRFDNHWAPYECELLNDSSCTIDFTPEEKQLLIQSIKNIKQKIPDLEKYFKSDHFQKNLKKLPPYWFDTEKVLSSMKERVQNMELSLKNDTAQNLIELAVQTIPSYKFHYILAMLHEKAFNNPYAYTVYHGLVGRASMEEVFHKIADEGYDFVKIQEWCDKPAISLQDTINLLELQFKALKAYPPTPQEIEDRKKFTQKVFSDYMSKAELDFKDMPEIDCRQYVTYKNVAQLYNECGLKDFPVGTIPGFRIQLMESNKTALIGRLHDCSWVLLCQKAQGEIFTVPIKVDEKIGFITVLEPKPQKLSIKEFNQYIKAHSR